MSKVMESQQIQIVLHLVYPNEDGVKNPYTRYDHSKLYQIETVARNCIPECILHSIIKFLSCFLRCIVILAYHIAICFNSNLWNMNDWVRDCWLTPRQHFVQLSYGEKKLSFCLFVFLPLQCLSFLELLFLTTGARGTDLPPPFSNFLFTNLFSIKFLYFFIISSLFPYFNLFVSVFIQYYANNNLHALTLYRY